MTKNLSSFIITLLLLSGCFSIPEPPVTTPPAVTEPAPPPTTTEPIVTGWVEVDGRQFYHDSQGLPLTGWQEIDGVTYYFLPEGAMATGQVDIDGMRYHFTSQGQRVILVNPWNYVPEDYEPELVQIPAAYGVEGSFVDSSCLDALVEMMAACNAQQPQVMVASAYRSLELQEKNFARKVKYYLDLGYSQEEAERTAATIIAVPGTSEHHLGLAVDIVDTRLWALEIQQEKLPGQQWLMEHCWEYGFIHRYPKNTLDVTGIVYEPWHYRYVGKELAAELHELGITLEEYLQSITY